MIKKQELQLKNKLSEIVKGIGYDKDIKEEVRKEFISRGLRGTSGSLRATWVLSENIPLNTLTDSDEDIRFLFLFTYMLSKALIKVNSEFKINPQDYFTELEYNQWKDYREAQDNTDIFPLVLEKAQSVGKKDSRIWQLPMSAQLLGEIDEKNAILYNFSTQRNPKITAFGEQINIDKNKIKEIKEGLLKGEQYPDPIILNVLNNGESNVSYNENRETLTIHEGSIINIVDGFHRKTSNTLALIEKPDLDFNWQVTVTFLSEKAAHDYMTQKDKQKPMRKEWIQLKDYSKPENLVIDVIMDDRLSELAKKMKEEDNYIRLNQALTKKSIIAEAIKECYEEQLLVNSNIRSIGKWVVEFTDYLMGLYSEEFIVNPYQIKETSMINNKNIFYAYIALSAKLQNNKDWKKILRKQMQSINFDKNDKLWKDLGMVNNNRDANKTLRTKLYNLLTRGV